MFCINKRFFHFSASSTGHVEHAGHVTGDVVCTGEIIWMGNFSGVESFIDSKMSKRSMSILANKSLNRNRFKADKATQIIKVHLRGTDCCIFARMKNICERSQNYVLAFSLFTSLL
jgi:hypothetical protein